MKIPVIPHARPLLFIFLLLPSLWSREKNLRSRPPIWYYYWHLSLLTSIRI